MRDAEIEALRKRLIDSLHEWADERASVRAANVERSSQTRIGSKVAPPGSGRARFFEKLDRARGIAGDPIQELVDLPAHVLSLLDVLLKAGRGADPAASKVYEQLLTSFRSSAASPELTWENLDTAQTEATVKLLAFYLPQFYPFPENDAWWGRGFTEWTNTSKAVPQFVGHDQPRLPGELGFYDLRLKQVRDRQVQLARSAGLHGFCFYYYWFSGQRLLDLPLDGFVNDPDFDFPFCLMWANENWTRRWDGDASQVLMEQIHTPENDRAFIEDACKYLLHPSYIRIEGKPMLHVYRPSLMTDPIATVKVWRDYMAEKGYPDLHLVAGQTFTDLDPIQHAFHAAVQFPPHHVVNDYTTIAQGSWDYIDRTNSRFDGKIISYPRVVRQALETPFHEGIQPEYPVYPTAFPSWDNTSRTPDFGAVFAFSSPALFKIWLSSVIETAKELPAENQFAFVNAWNEWAEGAYLEPDRKYGYANLNAVIHANAHAAVDFVSYLESDRPTAIFLGIPEDRKPHAELTFAYPPKTRLQQYLPSQSREDTYLSQSDLDSLSKSGAELILREPISQALRVFATRLPDLVHHLEQRLDARTICWTEAVELTLTFAPMLINTAALRAVLAEEHKLRIVIAKDLPSNDAPLLARWCELLLYRDLPNSFFQTLIETSPIVMDTVSEPLDVLRAFANSYP